MDALFIINARFFVNFLLANVLNGSWQMWCGCLFFCQVRKGEKWFSGEKEKKRLSVAQNLMGYLQWYKWTPLDCYISVFISSFTKLFLQKKTATPRKFQWYERLLYGVHWHGRKISFERPLQSFQLLLIFGFANFPNQTVLHI